MRSSPEPAQADSIIGQFLEFSPDAIIGVDLSGKIVLGNRQAETLFGYEPGELIGTELERLVPERFRAGHPRARDSYFAEPQMRPMGAGRELFALRRDGTEFPAEISLTAIEMEKGTVAVAAVRDISERAASEREKALQRQLDRARRLESVGQLAGGIAHDFNNLLGVILNYAEFVTGELDPDSPAREDVEEIRKAAERAAALTRQLLIFSRREVAKPEVLYLRDVVAELENLLRRALGERIELHAKFGPARLPVEIDSGQLEQVLVNLAVNARDAMPDGGRLIVEVDAVQLDEEYAYMHPDTAPGSYVRLTVSDTGKGMDAEAAERAFEPFYTTKDEGTGLGLATVYGIVTGAGGRIDIYSEVGIGTSVKIHLPTTEKPLGERPGLAEDRPQGSGETVLIVEDEPEVRRMTERILRGNGYRVIGTGDGEEALGRCREAASEIELLLTDVIMPGMLGTELVQRIRHLCPELPVLFMSGYSHEVLAPEAIPDWYRSAFIEKPFTAAELLSVISELLGSDAPNT